MVCAVGLESGSEAQHEQHRDHHASFNRSRVIIASGLGGMMPAITAVQTTLGSRTVEKGCARVKSSCIILSVMTGNKTRFKGRY